jgi:hypothetical protein
MEVEYQLTPDDFRALYRHLAQDQRQADLAGQHSRYWLEVGWAVVLVVADAGLLWAIGSLFLDQSGWLFDQLGWVGLVPMAVILLLINGALFLLVRDLLSGPRAHGKVLLYSMEDYIRHQQRAGYFHPDLWVKAVLDPAALVEVQGRRGSVGGVEISTTVTSRASWLLIEAIDVAAEHAFFKVGHAGWLILPRRVFDQEEFFYRFVAAARRYKLKDTELVETDHSDQPSQVPSEECFFREGNPS